MKILDRAQSPPLMAYRSTNNTIFVQPDDNEGRDEDEDEDFENEDSIACFITEVHNDQIFIV
jgi:hypothetical protein